MKEIIYVQKVYEYHDILKREYTKMPLFLKKLIFQYKNFLNRITKKTIESYNV